MSQMKQALVMYRTMIRTAKSLPSERRSITLQMIREAFRNNQAENDDEKIKKLIDKAKSSLGYLKIVTPKISNRSTNGQSGVTKIVMGDEDDKFTQGKLHKNILGMANKNVYAGSTRKAYSNWTGANMDPDSTARHYRSLRRAGFKDNADAKGIF